MLNKTTGFRGINGKPASGTSKKFHNTELARDNLAGSSRGFTRPFDFLFDRMWSFVRSIKKKKLNFDSKIFLKANRRRNKIKKEREKEREKTARKVQLRFPIKNFLKFLQSNRRNVLR